MPKGHERENSKIIDDAPDFADPSTTRTASERDVDIPHNPAVVAAVPPAPESESAVIIGHASCHVFGRVDTIDQGPESEEAPWEKKLEPDDMQVEVAEHAQLHWRVQVPVWLCIEYGYSIDVVQY